MTMLFFGGSLEITPTASAKRLLGTRTTKTALPDWFFCARSFA